MSRTRFLELAFDTPTEAEAEHWLIGRSPASNFAYVVTPNVDHVVRFTHAAPEIRRAYQDADLCLCDSRVLARLAWLVDVRLPVVPGSDLVASLFARVIRPGDRICLIGGSDETAASLGARYPLITIAHYNPPMGLHGNPTARAAAV